MKEQEQHYCQNCKIVCATTPRKTNARLASSSYKLQSPPCKTHIHPWHRATAVRKAQKAVSAPERPQQNFLSSGYSAGVQVGGFVQRLSLRLELERAQRGSGRKERAVASAESER